MLSIVALMLRTSRRIVPVRTRQTIITLTEAKLMKPCLKIPAKPSRK